MKKVVWKILILLLVGGIGIVAGKIVSKIRPEKKVEPEFHVGVWDGKNYREEFFGYMIETDGSAMITNPLDDQAMKEKLESGKYIREYEMHYKDSSRILCYTIMKPQDVSVNEMDEFLKQCAESLEDQKDSLAELYRESLGVEWVDATVEPVFENVYILGKERPCCGSIIKIYLYGMEIFSTYQKQFYFINGKYATTITVSAFSEEGLEKLLNSIKVID